MFNFPDLAGINFKACIMECLTLLSLSISHFCVKRKVHNLSGTGLFSGGRVLTNILFGEAVFLIGFRCARVRKMNRFSFGFRSENYKLCWVCSILVSERELWHFCTFSTFHDTYRVRKMGAHVSVCPFIRLSVYWTDCCQISTFRFLDFSASLCFRFGIFQFFFDFAIF